MMTLLIEKINVPPLKPGVNYAKPIPELKEATGLHAESRIRVFSLELNSIPQTSVFVYPYFVQLTDELIGSLPVEGGRFNKIYSAGISREFKDLSLEELDNLFMSHIQPMISVMDHPLSVRGHRILEHSYVPKAYNYIREVVQEMQR